MENVSIIERTDSEGKVIEHVIIDRGNNEFTSMLKSTYDAQLAAQVEHLTENVPANE